MSYTTKNLQKYRMELGLSLAELSYKAQITANQISLLEKQKIKKPQAATIRKLADALGRPITDFIEDESTKK